MEPVVSLSEELRKRLRDKRELVYFTGTEEEFVHLAQLTWRYKGPEKPPFKKGYELEMNSQKFRYGDRVPASASMFCEIVMYDEKNVVLRIYAISAKTTGEVNRVAA